MKRLKRKLAIVLAMIMVLTNAIPVFADNDIEPQVEIETIQEEENVEIESTDLECEEIEKAEIPEIAGEEVGRGVISKEETEPEEEIIIEEVVKEELSEEEIEEAFYDEETVDGVVITVTAEPGVIKPGTELWADRVKNTEVEEAIEEVVEDKREDNAQVIENYKFDIKLYLDGEEVEPNGKVTVSFALAKAAANADVNVYHIKEDENTEEIKEAEILESSVIEETEDEETPLVVEAESESFSYYVVEFTVGELQYVLNGDESVKLSVILEELELEGIVTAAEVSNEELFTVEKDAEGDDWTVTALQAFSSEEWLKVTIDGKKYTIIVTDTGEFTTWAEFGKALLNAEDGATLKLTQNLTAGEDDGNLKNPLGKTVTIDLNGFTLDRNAGDPDPDDYWTDKPVIYMPYNYEPEPRSPSTLIIVDSSVEQTGTITGGKSMNYGGGISVNDSIQTLIIHGGNITGNVCSNHLAGEETTANPYASGIGVQHGTLIMDGGSVTGNTVICKDDEIVLGGAVVAAKDFKDAWIFIGGNTVIKDNVWQNQSGSIKKHSDLRINKDWELTIGNGVNGCPAPEYGMEIGVFLCDTPAHKCSGAFTTNGSSDYVKYFFADYSDEQYVKFETDHLELAEIPSGSHKINIGSFKNGSVTSDKQYAKPNDTVTLTVSPDTGYHLKADTLKVTYNDGSTQTITPTKDATDDTKYTFNMPAYGVTVTAEFEEKALTPVDVPKAAAGLTYTGNEQTGVAEAAGYTVTNGKATKAGDYTATATLSEGYKWSDDTTDAKKITWSIAKASVPAPLLKDSVTIDYKAESIAPKEGYELSLGSGAAFDAGKITAKTAIDFTKSYYIRKAVDENHFASAELTYTPAHPAAPSGFTAKEESIENKKDGTFSGITSAMEYQKNGGEWISGHGTLSGLSDETITVRTKATDEAFKSLNYTYTFTASTGRLTVTMGEVIEKVPYDGLVTKPADPVREGFAFGGWYTEESCITAWNFAVDTVKDNMTLYPKWIKNEEKKAVIGGNVTEDDVKVPQATVELFLGTEKIAATVTDNDGNYKFDNVKLGTYNIIVTKAGGSKTKTELVTVDRTGEFSADVKLPKGDVSSKVEHKEGDTIPEAKSDISKTVVGGLDEIAEEQTPAGSDRITIKLTVEPKKDEETPAQQKIKKEAGEGKKVEFLDLSLLKQVNGGDEEDIGDKNNKLLTIVIPFNFEGVNITGMMILRNHGGNTSKLTKTPNSDGEYFTPNRSEGTLTIRAKKFSDYAIAYSEVTTPDPSDDESDERHITAYAEPVANATAITGSWQYKEAEDTWYYIVDGTYLKDGWYYLANPYSKTVKTGWFCFDEAGKMQRGWILSKLGHWFFTHDIKDGDLGRLETGWHKDDQDGLSYYLDLQTGRMYTGWHVIDGVTYYFTETSVKTTWKRDEKGRWVATEAIGKPLGSLDPTAEK